MTFNLHLGSGKESLVNLVSFELEIITDECYQLRVQALDNSDEWLIQYNTESQELTLTAGEGIVICPELVAVFEAALASELAAEELANGEDPFLEQEETEELESLDLKGELWRQWQKHNLVLKFQPRFRKQPFRFSLKSELNYNSEDVTSEELETNLEQIFSSDLQQLEQIYHTYKKNQRFRNLIKNWQFQAGQRSQEYYELTLERVEQIKHFQ